MQAHRLTAVVKKTFKPQKSQPYNHRYLWGQSLEEHERVFFGVGISKGWGQGSLACCSPWVAKLETNWQVINNRQWGTIHLIHMVLH